MRLRAARTGDDSGERRWERLWHGLFLGTIGVATVVHLVRGGTEQGPFVAVAAATALAACHILLVVRRDAERRPLWGSLVWLAVTLGLLTVLIEVDDVYAFVVYGLFPQLFVVLGRYGYAAMVLVVALLAWRLVEIADLGVRDALLSVVGSTALAMAIGVGFEMLERQKAAQRETIKELEAARSKVLSQGRQIGMLAERARISRELHDTVAQTLAGIVAQLEAAAAAFDRGDEPVARQHAARAQRLARDGLGEARVTVSELRPDLLDAGGLAAALGRVCASASDDPPVSLRVEGELRPLTPDVELALLRVAQESVSNACRHAAASEVTVVLRFLEDAVELEVCDDGSGFDGSRVTAAQRGGFGLRTMSERLDQLGGELRVITAPGAGTVIHAQARDPVTA